MQDDRGERVVALWCRGWSKASIAREVGIAHNTVARVVERWRETGRAHIMTRAECTAAAGRAKKPPRRIVLSRYEEFSDITARNARIIALYFSEGRRPRWIARYLRISASTVSGQVHREKQRRARAAGREYEPMAKEEALAIAVRTWQMLAKMTSTKALQRSINAPSA